jgi:NifU-like protein involved in Fe-S cluster formation
VGEGLVGAPAVRDTLEAQIAQQESNHSMRQCGDVMRLHIKVDPDTQVISDVRFKTFGCGSAM